MNAKLKTYGLPNGTVIHHMNKAETDLIYKEIFADEIYLRGGVQINDGDTIIDIGANIGLFLLFINERYRNVRMYSYEPIPATFSVLEKNAAACNGANSFQVFNLGVAKNPGSAVFEFHPRFSCSSTMHPDHSPEQQARAEEFTLNAFEELPNRRLAKVLKLMPSFLRMKLARAVIKYHTKSVEVPCRLTSVPEIVQGHGIGRVDVLKVDAEGAEVQILEGIGADNWPIIRQVMVETHRGKSSTDQVADILKEKGYRTSVDFSPSSPADEMVYAVR